VKLNSTSVYQDWKTRYAVLDPGQDFMLLPLSDYSLVLGNITQASSDFNCTAASFCYSDKNSCGTYNAMLPTFTF